MFHEIEKPAITPHLEQRTVRKVEDEFSKKFQSVPRQRGLIAEAETLANRLNAVEPKTAATPVISASCDSFSASVLIWYATLHAVRAAIAAAGLHIFREDREPKESRPMRELSDRIEITLVGFDVKIIVDQLFEAAADEIAEAA